MSTLPRNIPSMGMGWGLVSTPWSMQVVPSEGIGLFVGQRGRSISFERLHIVQGECQLCCPSLETSVPTQGSHSGLMNQLCWHATWLSSYLSLHTHGASPDLSFRILHTTQAFPGAVARPNHAPLLYRKQCECGVRADEICIALPEQSYAWELAVRVVKMTLDWR